MKQLFGRLAFGFAPKTITNKALKTLSFPGVGRMRDFEKTAINGARKSARRFGKFTIAEYTWGHGPRRALLIHGWEGRAANFAAIVPVLVDAGFTVTAFDAPAHGESTRSETTLFDFGNLVSEYLREQRYELFITHSFGSVPLSFAFNAVGAYPVKNIVLITSPNRFTDRVHQVVKQLHFPPRLSEKLLDEFSVRYNVNPRALSVAELGKHIVPLKTLLIHGVDDKVLPIEWSRQVADAWQNVELVEMPETGHYRILWDPRTQKLIHNLITSTPSTRNKADA